MWPERVPGTESAKPTMSLPENAPMTWPPTLSATTNMRSGTSSASEKFHTSFCRATQARSSSRPRQWRMRMESVMVGPPYPHGFRAGPGEPEIPPPAKQNAGCRDDALQQLCEVAGGRDDLLQQLCEVAGGCDDALLKLCEAASGRDDALRKLCKAAGGRDDALRKLCEVAGGRDDAFLQDYSLLRSSCLASRQRDSSSSMEACSALRPEVRRRFSIH